MKYKLSIDSVEYVLAEKKQSIQEVSTISGISIEELDEYLGFKERYIVTNNQTSLDRKRLFNYSVDRMGVAKIHEEHCLS